MKKSLRNTIMTEEMIVHEKIEEILKERTLTLDDLNDIYIPPNFDFEEVISTVKDYASKTKQNISDLIKNNSFVQSLKRYVSGDTTELSLDQESDNEDIEEEDIEQTKVYEGNPHITKNTLDLQVVGFPSLVKVSDYQLALIAYTLNLFAGKINSSLEKVESIIESKYKTSLKSAFKELFLEEKVKEKKYKKFSKDSHEEFINICLEKEIILKNNGLYEITDKEELFNFIALSGGEYHTVSPMGYFIEKLVAISLNDKMEIESFNIGEKFILCILLILNNNLDNNNEFIEKIYKSKKVDSFIRDLLIRILNMSNINNIKNYKINKFIESCLNVLNKKNSNYEIKHENKTYDFTVNYKDEKSKNLQPFIFIDVKLKKDSNDNYFSSSKNLLLTQISSSFGEDIKKSYKRIKNDEAINDENIGHWNKLKNKKFINALFNFSRTNENFKIETERSFIKINLSEDAFKIKYKLYNLQSLFSDVLISDSNYYNLSSNFLFDSNDPNIKKDQYDNDVDFIDIEAINSVLEKQQKDNNFYYNKFKKDFSKKISNKSNSRNTEIMRLTSFFEAFRDKDYDYEYENSKELFKKSSNIHKDFYKENWNRWYNNDETQEYIKSLEVELQARYYYLNKFINADTDYPSRPDYDFYTYILTKEKGKPNKLKRLYKKYLDVLSNIDANDKSKIFKNRLFQALFFENPRKWLDKPVKDNRKEIAESEVDIVSWNKFKDYTDSIKRKSQKTKNNISYLERYFK